MIAIRGDFEKREDPPPGFPSRDLPFAGRVNPHHTCRAWAGAHPLMTEPITASTPTQRGIRWWPALLIVAVAALVLGLVGLGAATLRIRGVSGDLLPILEPRWAQSALPSSESPTNWQEAATSPTASPHPDFPQFLGPNRTATLTGVALDSDWKSRPPTVLWRQPIGAGWSGFAAVGDRALTQEQRGDQESVTCYELRSGRLLWMHGDAAHYTTTIAGVGPRCTPTVISNRVFTVGATGILNCLDLASGQLIWQRNLADDAGAKMPEWGFAGSPLCLDGLVIVSAGGQPDRSLLAYRAESGELAWAAGSAPVNYSSLFVTELAGVRQILAFNGRRITAHDAVAGTVLWEYPWGIGQPHVAVPVVAGANRVVFSSGYGVGAELLEIRRQTDGALTATRVWQSRRMKAKFANLVARDGFLYGLDDGILACLDLADGSQRWKEGRYGHGQGLLVGEHFLLMAEKGELVLLRPTPEAPNELHRFHVFNSKTWNPIALAGEYLLVRNDLEAACLRIAVAEPSRRQRPDRRRQQRQDSDGNRGPRPSRSPPLAFCRRLD